MKFKKIDINCDMAELERVDDLVFMPWVSSVNICCGEHAGNPDKINSSIRNAIKHKLKIGAHPSYPDRENFGRRSMQISNQELTATLFEQILYIKLLVEKEGRTLHHVKAHGALYNDMVTNDERLDCFLDVIRYIDPSLKIYALAHSSIVDKIRAKGFTVVPEAFMDRKYTKELFLTSRAVDGSVFKNIEQLKSQLELMLEGKVRTELKDVYDNFEFETICLHSDTPGAEKWAQEIHEYLKSRGIEIA